MLSLHFSPLLLRARGAAGSRARPLAIVVAIAACLAGSHTAAHAQNVDPKLWATNGPVQCVVRDGGTVYIGGAFTLVGRATGYGVPIDVATGGLPPSFPQVSGWVYAVAADGAGGWYVGGHFTSVGGIPRSNLAHIAADLSVSAWNPNAGGPTDAYVSALAVSGSTVYVGGDFTSIGGQARNNIAALDAVTGTPAAWNPNANSWVRAIVVSGSAIYAGGDFNVIGGQARNRVAALDATTGAATSWSPNLGPAIYSGVYALAMSGSTLYVGGDFTSIGGQARNYIAALDATTAAATAWNPNASGQVRALAVSGSTIYAGGGFASIGGQTRYDIAALDATSGAATAWDPSASGVVDALVVSGSTVYAGGWFTSIGGQPRNCIAALDAATGAATAWDPSPGDYVLALAVSGTTVYAGGYFNIVGGQARNHIAALDATTGAATPWNPNASDIVEALAVSGSTVYAGGRFTTIGGLARNYIAALDATTGAATAWNPNVGGCDPFQCPHVVALAVNGSTVYAGGDFTSIGGQARNYIAALDAVTGAATPWNPNPDYGGVLALAVSGATVYAAGVFTNIGGQARNNIAALDAATGAATAWNPNPNNFINALRVNGGTVYVGGPFTSIGGQARNQIAALDAATGAATAWNPNPNNRVNALGVSGGTVYVGGTFTSIGGQARNSLAALDAATGVATTWNASLTGSVSALAVSGSTVYAGGGFTTNGEYQQRNLAAIDDAVTALVLSTFRAEPVQDGVRIVWEFSDPGAFSSVALERASASTGPWTVLSAERSQEGASTVALDRTTEAALTYYYRLTVTYSGGGWATFGPLSVTAGRAITAFDLEGISPNPTSGKAVIEYSVPRAAQVHVALFDLQGREVVTLASGFHAVGRYQVTWSGETKSGRARPGVYFVRMLGGGVSKTRRVVVSD